MTEVSRHIEHISFFTRTVGIPIAVLLTAAALAAVLWYYRSTVPSVSGWMGRTLSILRFAALALLIAGLAEPVLHVVMSVVKRESTAVLLDTSSSLDLPTDTGRKREALGALNRVQSQLGDTAQYYSFDSGFRPLDNNEPEFAGNGTDIMSAVENAASGHGVSSIILISDGRWNLGTEPGSAKAPEGVVIHTVLAGSTADVPEYALTSASTSPVGYEGKSHTVEAVITSTRQGAEPVKVEILDGIRTIAEGTASFDDSRQARVGFEIPLGEPGPNMFTAVIRPETDTVAGNNSRVFRIQVLKSTFRVLLIAATPSADLAFVRRALESDPAFDVDVRVDTGHPLERERKFGTDSADAVVIFDGGGPSLTREDAVALVKRAGNGCGVWLTGSSFEGEGVPVLFDLSPALLTGDAVRLTGDFIISPTQAGAMHFLTAGIPVPGRESLEALPPLTSIVTVTVADENSRILATATGSQLGKDSLPAIIAGRHGAGKVLFTPVSGIWRWKLMMAGAGRESSFYTTFVTGSIRWLTSDTETSPLTITTDSGAYLSGQEIKFEGRLFDKVYMPVSGADISLVIDDDPARKVFFEETSPAVYTGRIRDMEPGEHRFTATAYVDGTGFAESEGTFRVERSSLETLDTSPAPDILAALAGRTGGLSVTTTGVDSIFSVLDPSTITERTEHDTNLSMNPFLPVLVILFLVLEWTIRKRRGML